jgi:hypothetical protein
MKKALATERAADSRSSRPEALATLLRRPLPIPKSEKASIADMELIVIHMP